MMKHLKIWMIVGLLVLALPIAAQEETNTETDTANADTVPESAEEDLPEITFFHSTAGFNVPVLTDWTDQSDTETARFVNEDLQARILVTAAAEGDDAAAVVAEAWGLSLGEPIYTNRISTADGTWEQTYYDEGDTNLSLLTKVEEGRRYIIAFVEDNPDAAIYMPLVDHTFEDDSALPAIDAAVEALGLAEDADPTSTDTLTLDTGTWETATYETDDTTITGYGLRFGVTDYVALAVGDASTLPELADAYNTTLLGGFFLTLSNVEFLYLGVAMTTIIMLILVGSIAWRWRNARHDLQIVEQLQAD